MTESWCGSPPQPLRGVPGAAFPTVYETLPKANGSAQELGREGWRHRRSRDPEAAGSGGSRKPRQPPPSRPRRSPAALPATSRGREGKLSLQILPGRASRHSPPPRKSVACSFPWKPDAERRSEITEEAPRGCGTCSLCWLSLLVIVLGFSCQSFSETPVNA